MNKNYEDFLAERRRALEESFFHKRNQELLDKLKRQLSSQEHKKALATASGISDDAVLDHLLAAHISGETIAAVAIAPLVVVAWADGKLDEREKQAILSASETEGIAPHTLSYELLQDWLNSPPNDVLLSAWKDYVRAARQKLSSQALEALKTDVLGRARKVAHASGGILGLAKISAAEEQVLRDLERTLQA